MTSWIPGFGGGKSKEEQQAEQAKEWHESHLGTGDEFFTHSRSAVEDTGSFKVTDVRPRPKEADRGGARLVRIPKGKYEKPPQVGRDLQSGALIKHKLTTSTDSERSEILRLFPHSKGPLRKAVH
jgi:hypothetical protein